MTQLSERASDLIGSGEKGPKGRNFVQQIRKDPNANPKVATLIAICDALGVSLSYIMTGETMTQGRERSFRQFAILQERAPHALQGLLDQFAGDLEEDTRHTDEPVDKDKTTLS